MARLIAPPAQFNTPVRVLVLVRVVLLPFEIFFTLFKVVYRYN